MYICILTGGYQTSCIINLTLFLYISGHDCVMLTSLLNSTTLSAITWKYSRRLKRTLVKSHWDRGNPPGKDRGRLQHHLRLSVLPVEVTGHGRSLSSRPSTQDQNEFYTFLIPPINYLSFIEEKPTYVLSATLKYLERLILAMNGAIRNQREVGRSFCMRMWGWWAGDGQVKWVAGWKIWASNMRAKPSCE